MNAVLVSVMSLSMAAAQAKPLAPVEQYRAILKEFGEAANANWNAYETKNLKERMDKEKMNWRSFAHQDAINAKWNPSTPGYYVLDPSGVIRHKWIGAPGEKAIDTALENLIHEAESSVKKPLR